MYHKREHQRRRSPPSFRSVWEILKKTQRNRIIYEYFRRTMNMKEVAAAAAAAAAKHTKWRWGGHVVRMDQWSKLTQWQWELRTGSRIAGRQRRRLCNVKYEMGRTTTRTGRERKSGNKPWILINLGHWSG